MADNLTMKKADTKDIATNGVPSFADWRQTTNDSLMTTAENLLEKLEDVADMLLEIDELFVKNDNNITAATPVSTEATTTAMLSERPAMVQRFHEGVDSARSIIGVLKKEKWRLSRREMSVEMRMGELEEYKSHLKSDMSSLNQTVEVLSLRIVQLENQLVDAQESAEQQEAEIAEQKRQSEEYKDKFLESQKKIAKLKKTIQSIEAQTPHTLITENTMIKNEIAMLMDENTKLKELIRNMDNTAPASDDEHLTRLTRDFLRQLSSLDDENEKSMTTVDVGLSGQLTSVFQDGDKDENSNDEINKLL